MAAHKLACAGLPLPEIYVCGSRYEAKPIAEAGIPYVITRLSDIDIIKVILLRTLRMKFPRIKWGEVLGIRATKRLNVFVPGGPTKDEDGPGSEDASVDLTEDEGTCSGRHEVADIATDWRVFDNGGTEYTGEYETMSIDDFCDDAAAHVNVDQLQSLGLLPKFMSDAADAIRINIESRMQWRECYNKRLGCCVGDVDYGTEAPNLIILDISSSIPEGISATMLQLVATLREQASAELIVTGSTSMYWGRDDRLPDPSWIRGHIGRSNEAKKFIEILTTKIAGRHLGSVISFGDNDCPDYWTVGSQSNWLSRMSGTRVEQVLHYHTTYNRQTGYARWCASVDPSVREKFDTDWCEVMR